VISESQLTAIHMMAAGGLSPERIAEVLGVSVELVRSVVGQQDQGRDKG
jgi:DNA-binding CsgD family transcriptional regulator